MTNRAKTVVFLLTLALAWVVEWPSGAQGQLSRASLAPRPSRRLGVRAVARAVQPDDLVPVPAEFEGRAQLLAALYGDYDSSQIVIYLHDHPEIILAAADDYPGRVRQALAQLKDRLLDLDRIVGLASDPEAELADAPELLTLYRKLPPALGPDRFARAAGPGVLHTARGRRDEFIAAYARASAYLPAMERIFEEQGVPPVFTRLVFVESMFDRDARSSKGAYGLWQFLDSTARPHLAMNYAVDERRDPIASSQAAARVLAENYELLRSWPLAVKAYNTGAPGLVRTLRRSRFLGGVEATMAIGSGSGFYLRLAGVVRAEARLGLTPAAFPNSCDPARYDLVGLPRAHRLPELARQLGIDPDLLILYNPAWTPAVEQGLAPIPAGYLLRAPHGSEQVIREAL
jgi:membrane-bound lytic murein transglycosylase D